MKFIAALLLTMLLGYLVHIFNSILPWWCVAIAAFIAGAAVPQKAGWGWLSGFLGVALLWAILAWQIDTANAGIMARRMAQVLPFAGNTTYLFLGTALVGGLVGGFASLSGVFMRSKAS